MAEKTDRETYEKAELLLRAIEEVYPSTKVMLWKNFLRGLAFGLGTTIGVSLVLAFLTYILGQLPFAAPLRDLINGVPLDRLIQK